MPADAESSTGLFAFAFLGNRAKTGRSECVLNRRRVLHGGDRTSTILE